MSEFYNPDYPVANTGGFAQHTYQPDTMASNQFFYPGTSFNPGMYPPDSRRNDGPLMNPMYPNTNAPAMQYMPTGNGMPFSSYPPTPNTTPQAPSFNSLVDSRRFQSAPNDPGVNPWAQNQASQPVQYQSVPQNTPSPWMYQQTMMSYSDPNCSALYSNPTFGFDRSNGSWDNSYSQPTIVPPTINWGAPQQVVPQFNQPVQYQTFNYPQTQMSWKDIADKNWGSGTI